MEWGKSPCGKYKIESLTAGTVEGALRIIRDTFFKDEIVCIATEVNINPVTTEELLELCADAALDGVSLVGVEIGTGKVVAVSFNKLQTAASESSSDKSFLEDFSDFSDLDGRCDLFEKYGVDCSLEIMFLGTLREHRYKKLGQTLCKASLEVGRKLKSGPVSQITLADFGPKYAHMKPRKLTAKIPLICQALATSVGTQKIGRALDFTTHFRISFKEFTYDGKSYAERVGFDPYCELIARKI